MKSIPDETEEPSSTAAPGQRTGRRTTGILAIIWLLTLAGALGFCHIAARIAPRPVSISLLYTGAVTALAAVLITSRLRRRSIGKPTRSFFVQGISPGILRLLTLCAILSGVVFLDERIGAHIGLGMVCGSLAGMIAEVAHLTQVDASGMRWTRQDERKAP